jgi:hypothetical protein
MFVPHRYSNFVTLATVQNGGSVEGINFDLEMKALELSTLILATALRCPRHVVANDEFFPCWYLRFITVINCGSIMCDDAERYGKSSALLYYL